MKRSIYITGIICLAIVFLATIFKISHFAGANIMLLIGLSATALLFLPLAYITATKSKVDKLLNLLYTAALLSFSIDFIGMLFKILHWPGAKIFLMIGIPLPFIFFLPVYIFYHIKRNLKTDLNFFAILLFMIYLGVFSSLFSVDLNYNNNMIYAHKSSEIAKANKYLSLTVNNEKQSEISSSAKQLVDQIEDMKLKLVKQFNSDNENLLLPDGNINYFEIENKGNGVSYELLNEIGFNKFNEQFDIFSNKLMEINPDSNAKRLIEEINDYRIIKNNDTSPVIAQLNLIVVLNTLTDWQNKLLLIRYINESQNVKLYIATK